MIKKIKIENFQSHKNSEFDLHKNINVVQGLSDSGKSAFIRAIKSLTNKDNFYVRNGTKTGLCEIHFDDRKIKREFTKKFFNKCPYCKEKIEKNIDKCSQCEKPLPIQASKDFYQLDDIIREKFGAKLTQNIKDFIRITPIEISNKEIHVNYQTQFDDFFFIGKSYDNIRNKLISMLIVDSEKIDLLITKLNKDKYSVSNNLKYSTEEYDKICEKLEMIEDDFKKSEKIAITINEKETKINDLTQLKESLLNKKQLILKSLKILRAKSHIKQLKSQIKALEEKEKLLTGCFETQNNLKNYKNKLFKFKKYDKIKKSWFEKSFKQIKETVKNIEKHKTIQDKIDDLKTIKIKIIKNISAIKTAKTAKQSYQEKIEKKQKELCKNIDEGICPIIKDKYCKKCTKILKDEMVK